MKENKRRPLLNLTPWPPLGRPPTESHSVSYSRQTQTGVHGTLHFPVEQFAQAVTFDQVGDRKDMIFVELPRT